MTADIEAGVLYNRSGRRMIALTDDFLIGLHRALEKECAERAPNVLYTCGKRWGANFSNGLVAQWSEFYEAPLPEFPLAMIESLIIQEFGHNGWGILEFDYQHWSQGVLMLSLEGAIMAELLNDSSKGPADVLTAGIFAGMFTHFMGGSLGCIQSYCTKKVAGASRFLLSAESRVESVKASSSPSESHDDLLAKLLSTKA